MPALRRLAIPPVTVLMEHPASDWMGLAASFVLQQDLATSRSVLPLFAGDESTAYLSGATEILRMTLEQRGDVFHLSGSSFDLSSQRIRLVFEENAGVTSGLLDALERIAHQIDGARAQRFSTANFAALKPFTVAAVTQNPQVRTELLQSAIAADPSFGLARIALAETLGPRALEGVKPQSFTPFDQARWAALAARLTNAPSERQMETEQAILKLAPNNVDALALLGTLRFLSGNQAEGERLLRQAINLSPANGGLQLQLRRLQEQAKQGKK